MDSIFSSNPPGLTGTLSKGSLFVAGAGGLGSNVCVMLVRAGIGKITVVDFDFVEPGNLNRQCYFQDQIGMPKVNALRDNLLRINPELNITAIQQKITADNCANLIPEKVNVIFECFDAAEAKAMLTGFALSSRPSIPIVAASGVAGIGKCEDIIIRRGPGNLYVVGDCSTEATPESGTIASRVTQVAAMQAHLGIKLMLREN